MDMIEDRRTERRIYGQVPIMKRHAPVMQNYLTG